MNLAGIYLNLYQVEEIIGLDQLQCGQEYHIFFVKIQIINVSFII